MTFRGRVQNGVVVPEAGVTLPEGAEVQIDVGVQSDLPDTGSNAGSDSGQSRPPSMYERYRDVIGVIKDLPSDASERVDDLLYGSSSP